MSYQVLARKWRPRNFDEVLGQTHVVRALKNALDLERLHHAYLFAGTRGVGKTTLARILAKCLNCETGIVAKPCGKCSVCTQIDEGRFVDLAEIDAASRTGVDSMRALLEDVHYAPNVGRFKVYLIDEVHMLSTSSFNALLKTLEEPPDHVKFFFATTHPRNLPVTILSRCLQFNLTRLLPGEIEEYLARMLKTEKVPCEDAALKQISIAAEGSVRDSLSLLDQAIAYGNGSLKTQEVEAMLGLAARDEVSGLLRCVIENNATGLFEMIENMYRKAVDFAGVLGDLLELLHAIAVRQAVPDAGAPAQFDADEVAALAAAATPEDMQLYYQIALNGKRDLPFLPDAKSAFEMTMLRMLSFCPLESAAPTSSKTTAATAAPAAPPVPTSSAQAPPAQTRAQTKAPTRTQRGKASAAPAAPAPTPPAQTPPAQASQPARNAPPPTDTVPDEEVAAGDTVASVKFAEFATPEGWPQLITRLQIEGAQKQICLNSVFSVQSENEVTLALDKGLEAVKTPESESRIRDALVRIAGRDMKVNFKLASPEEETPEQARCREELQRQRDAENAIDNNAVVQSLKSDFSASIIPGSTRPTEEPGQ